MDSRFRGNDRQGLISAKRSICPVLPGRSACLILIDYMTNVIEIKQILSWTRDGVTWNGGPYKTTAISAKARTTAAQGPSAEVEASVYNFRAKIRSTPITRRPSFADWTSALYSASFIVTVATFAHAELDEASWNASILHLFDGLRQCHLCLLAFPRSPGAVVPHHQYGLKRAGPLQERVLDL
jgi:hypothetical protein